jgi:hypothetical protein
MGSAGASPSRVQAEAKGRFAGVTLFMIGRRPHRLEPIVVLQRGRRLLHLRNGFIDGLRLLVLQLLRLHVRLPAALVVLEALQRSVVR